MPFVGLFSLIIQISLMVHVVRTGRDKYWISILLIPVVGPVVYVITQVLPDLLGSRTARVAARRLVQAVDPERELRKRKEDLETADTVANRIALAEECVEASFPAEAILLYESCLTGMHADDPKVLGGLAEAYFAAGDPKRCKETLDELLAAHPDLSSQSGHLLYARSLESLGDTAAAAQEYENLVAYASGEEARIRYAMFLREQGREDEANMLFRETLRRARRGGCGYRKMQKEWIAMAQRYA